ncbi:MAG: hypothetical protein RJA70_64 [Pseudomonadota bacterium]|jgi:hypothetical protein
MIEVPELYEGLLTEAELRDLLFDISTEASSVELQFKGSAQGRAQPGDENADSGPIAELESACARLVAAQVAGIQVRYIHAGVAWCDTVLRGPAGFRLIRVNLDRVSALQSSD